ncbi:SUKH-3 domain-containing protein [Streptomyces acidicola]|uniref:SUKH-3 domain-containing protein n=1 Tax=Streptomyces acidicola TaxID=2596892 RepID=UPI0037AE7697
MISISLLEVERMAEFHPPAGRVAETLASSGWTPDRQVSVDDWKEFFESRGVAMHAAARDFLSSFGGLSVDVSGPGVSCAREPFSFDPMWCEGDEDRFLDWGAELGLHLFPVGGLDNGRFVLGMDEHGVIYLLETWVASFGPWHEALEALILGIKSQEIA